MNRGMDEHEIGIARLQPFYRTGSTMRRAIIDNPKDTFCLGIGWLAHHVVNKAIKRSYAASAFASVEQFGAMNIKGCDIGPSTASGIFMLHLHRRSRLGRIGGMTPPPRLDAGFFIGRQNKLVLLKGASFPYSFIKIQNPAGFLGKLGIARENPGAVAPRTNGILMKPSPNGAVTDCCGQSRSPNLPTQISNAPSGKRSLMDRRQFTGNRLNLNDDLPGGKSGDVPDEVALQVREDVFQRSVFATC